MPVRKNKQTNEPKQKTLVGAKPARSDYGRNRYPRVSAFTSSRKKKKQTNKQKKKKKRYYTVA